MSSGLSPDEKFPIEKLTKDMVFLKNVVSNPNIEVGDYTYYAGGEHFEAENVLFGVRSKLKIGKFCQIAKGAKFVLGDADHPMKGFSTFPFFVFGKYNDSCPDWDYEIPLPVKGDTVIGNDVWLGHECVIMPGVTVGDGAIIGTRAVVTKDVPPYAIVGGNPAKVLRMRFPQEVIDQLVCISWWNWDIQKITENLQAILSNDVEAL